MAVQFEREIREKDDELWLTQAAVPLDEVDMSDGGQMDLIGGCSGGCFT